MKSTIGTKRVATVLLILVSILLLLQSRIAVWAEDFSGAVPISVNQSVSGNVNKGYGEEKDYYKLSVSNSGSLQISFSNPLQSDSGSYWKVSLYNEEYKELCSRNIYGNKSNTILPAVGVPAGVYYVEVSSSSYSGANSTDTYSLSANYEASDYWEKELNEEFTTASPIQLNASYSGTTVEGYGEEKDYYKFSLVQAGVIEVVFSNPLQIDASDYWKIYLYDKEYREICSTVIKGNQTSTGLAASGLDQGTYYIQISSSSYSSAASTDIYSFIAKFTPSNYWEKELNEDFVSASLVELNNIYQGTTSGGNGSEKDYYRFNILSAASYRVGIKTPNLKDSDTYWQMYLYNAEYQEISSVYVRGNKTTNYIDKTFSPGTYYISVESASYSSANISPYQIRVAKDTRTVNKIKLTEKTVSMWKGDTHQLYYTLNPSTIATKVTWKSSKTRVAAVSKNGMVKAKRVGKATITATTSNGKKATCKITVNN